MIKFADNTTKPLVWDMWKTVFGDSDDYMEIYFREKYRNENTLIYFDRGKAVSSLQMLPFSFSFHGTEIPIAYFSGLCTLPEARRKGFMGALIEKSFDEMGKNGIPLAILVPQEESVMDFYRPFGFTQTFDAGTPLPDLRKIVSESENLETAYKSFDSFFRQRDMTVQKSFDDFRAIVKEATLFDFPSKRSLVGMARVIDAEKLLSLFADRYKHKLFSVTIHDELLPMNNATFAISEGKSVKNGNSVSPTFHFNIRTLAQVLLGYHTSWQDEPLRSVFPEKTPQMHFMME